MEEIGIYRRNYCYIYQIIKKLHDEGFAWSRDAQKEICYCDDIELVKSALQNVHPNKFILTNISNFEIFQYCVERGFSIDLKESTRQAIKQDNIEFMKAIVVHPKYKPFKISC
jgi:hypothetical protein